MRVRDRGEIPRRKALLVIVEMRSAANPPRLAQEALHVVEQGARVRLPAALVVVLVDLKVLDARAVKELEVCPPSKTQAEDG